MRCELHYTGSLAFYRERAGVRVATNFANDDFFYYCTFLSNSIEGFSACRFAICKKRAIAFYRERPLIIFQSF